LYILKTILSGFVTRQESKDMSIKKITAWQASTGQCYAKKTEAYHAEMVWLLQTQGEVIAKIHDNMAFERAVNTRKELVGNLRALREELNPKRPHDAGIVQELDGFLSVAEKWLAGAETLQKKMDEPDGT
jgi:hypothetical protein